jgi:hypothetical protein
MFLLPALLALALQQAPATQPGQPDPSGLVVSVLSMGPGDAVFEKFGHNALRIRDTSGRLDVSYNWGMFSFHQERFIIRLITGEMLYWMESFPSPAFIDHYIAEDRDVWEQVLNLSDEQKARILALARENDRDENRFYPYNYYLDNCSSRVRDIINTVLDGQLRAASDSALTGTTFRSHTRRLLNDSPMAYLGVQLVLGHPADREISRWEEMFLPVRLMRHIRDISITGPEGERRPLVSSERVVHKSVHRKPELEEVRPKTVAYLALGLVFSGLLVLLANSSANGSARAASAFAITSVTWCVVAGVAGTLALCMWLFTGHTFMYENETTMLLTPLHLVLPFFLGAAVVRARRQGAARGIVIAIALLSIVALTLWIVPGLGQRNAEMIALAVPLNLALAAGLEMILRRRTATL